MVKNSIGPPQTWVVGSQQDICLRENATDNGLRLWIAPEQVPGGGEVNAPDDNIRELIKAAVRDAAAVATCDDGKATTIDGAGQGGAGGGVAAGSDEATGASRTTDAQVQPALSSQKVQAAIASKLRLWKRVVEARA